MGTIFPVLVWPQYMANVNMKSYSINWTTWTNLGVILWVPTQRFINILIFVVLLCSKGKILIWLSKTKSGVSCACELVSGGQVWRWTTVEHPLSFDVMNCQAMISLPSHHVLLNVCQNLLKKPSEEDQRSVLRLGGVEWHIFWLGKATVTYFIQPPPCFFVCVAVTV